MLIFYYAKTTIWRQNYKKFLKCASILRKKYHFAYLLLFLVHKWVEEQNAERRNKDGSVSVTYHEYPPNHPLITP